MFFFYKYPNLKGPIYSITSSKTIWIYGQTIKIINVLVNFTITFSHTPTLDKLNGWDSHLDGWVILVNEVVLDKLDGESALAHTSCPDHHKFVLRHAWGESGGRDFIPHLSHIRAEMNKSNHLSECTLFLHTLTWRRVWPRFVVTILSSLTT